MSRIGKQPIAIPEKVEVKMTDGLLSVKGPLGLLEREFSNRIKISIGDKEIILEPVKTDIDSRALWGTYGSHIRNMIEGVTKGYQKKLLIEGVGYKYAVAGTQVVLDLGFSHQVKVNIPDGIKVVVEKNAMTISGIDKELVGQFAAIIRSYKVTEPYKGKGIRYENEVILRKQGKKSTA